MTKTYVLMKEKMLLYILIVLIDQSVTLASSCRASTATISYVSSCPKNKEEWEKASRLKNCESIAVIQNCTAPVNFKYHCLMNHWRNTTLEVCAPIFYIQGYCAEYNTRVKEVVENYNEGFECLTFPESQRCPARYASNEAYKYQACYIYNHERTTTTSRAVTNVIYITEAARSEENGVICLEFIIIVCLLLLLFLITLVLVLVKYRRQISDKLFPEGCKSRDNQSSDIKEEENIGLLHTDKHTNADQASQQDESKVSPNAELSATTVSASLPGERERSSNAVLNATTSSDTQATLNMENVEGIQVNGQGLETIGIKSTEQNSKTSQEDESKASSNAELSTTTVSASLPGKRERSSNAELSATTSSGQGLETIGIKSTEQNSKTSHQDESKTSSNAELSTPTVSASLPGESERSSNAELSTTISSGQGLETIGSKSTEQNSKTSQQDESKASSNAELSTTTVSASLPGERQGSYNTDLSATISSEKAIKSIGSKSTEQNSKTSQQDESKASSNAELNATTVSEKAIKSIGSKSTEQNSKTSQQDESKASSNAELSTTTVSASLPGERQGSYNTDLSSTTSSGQGLETIGSKSTEQYSKTSQQDKSKASSNAELNATTVSASLPDERKGSSNAELSATTSSEKGTESIGSESTEQKSKTSLPDERERSSNAELSATTLSVEKSNENSKIPPPRPKAPPVPTSERSSETAQKIVSKHGKSKQAPTLPPENINKR
ncbi:serine-rich adhesin for platelets-like isoform X3 [Ostrea edulis]|uniref:serine-rich adhesin for platelets-like isoform X3 n=1 Tax=Ostrea edulis TaxID=37623 RepID=UPI0024AF5ED1|nr:serine-rich adhesin for platelets-like isoform X3 [Ostrea edulis]